MTLWNSQHGLLPWIPRWLMAILVVVLVFGVLGALDLLPVIPI